MAVHDLIAQDGFNAPMFVQAEYGHPPTTVRSSVSITVGGIPSRAVIAAVLNAVAIVGPGFKVAGCHPSSTTRAARWQIFPLLVLAKSAAVAR
jgi:hypothetical protein